MSGSEQNPPPEKAPKQPITAEKVGKIIDLILGQDIEPPVPKPPPAAPPPVNKPAVPVILADSEEVQRIIDFGLGRGIDATDPSPWRHKTTFQVRHVTMENIIGTEEGGALQSYKNEISSVTALQCELSASIAVPQVPVNFGLEGEYSRSVSKNQVAFGKRVVNRTISFQTNFEDAPQSLGDDTHASANMDGVVSVSSSIDYPTVANANAGVDCSKFTFEERLSKFLLERALQRYNLKKEEANRRGESPSSEPIASIGRINVLEDMAKYFNEIDQKEKDEILKDCEYFVRHFRITHYVSSIQLGAVQYRVMNETEYLTKVSSGGKVGVKQLADVAVKAGGSKKLINKASELRQIGQINKTDEVERRSYHEAVVGIQMQPIHNLVKLRSLHVAMWRALSNYIKEKEDKSAGPFIIGCGDEPDRLYLEVHEENHEVKATKNVNKASHFHIIPTDDDSHPYEFNIGWRKGKEPRAEHSGHTPKPLFRYLDAKVTICGTSPGPLVLRDELEAQHARLTLHQRIIGRKLVPADPKDWVNGKDKFFISCS